MYLRVLKKDNVYYPQYWEENRCVKDGVISAHWENFRDRRGKVFDDEIFYDREIDVSFKDMESAIAYATSKEKKEKEETIKKFGEVVWKNKSYESIR